MRLLFTRMGDSMVKNEPMKNTLLLLVTLFLFACSNDTPKEEVQQEESPPNLPYVSKGKIERLPNFSSQYIDARNIDIWLPEGYDSTDKSYPVIYMHDGQNLYDANNTFNKQEWEVDEIAGTLMSQGKLTEFIVVGVWNNGEMRYTEYFPQKAMDNISQDFINEKMEGRDIKKEALADNYLKFLTQELKPHIDANFRTLPDRENTTVMGSSMGGLISMYAICEYPEVFGKAGCLSTHWVGIFEQNEEIPNAFNTYLTENMPPPANHKIYFDYGDRTLDSLYKPHQVMIDQTMKTLGYSDSLWMTMEFKGADHSEQAWAARLDIPLQFLFN